MEWQWRWWHLDVLSERMCLYQSGDFVFRESCLCQTQRQTRSSEINKTWDLIENFSELDYAGIGWDIPLSSHNSQPCINFTNSYIQNNLERMKFIYSINSKVIVFLKPSCHCSNLKISIQAQMPLTNVTLKVSVKLGCSSTSSTSTSTSTSSTSSDDL